MAPAFSISKYFHIRIDLLLQHFFYWITICSFVLIVFAVFVSLFYGIRPTTTYPTPRIYYISIRLMSVLTDSRTNTALFFHCSLDKTDFVVISIKQTLFAKFRDGVDVCQCLRALTSIRAIFNLNTFQRKSHARSHVDFFRRESLCDAFCMKRLLFNTYFCECLMSLKENRYFSIWNVDFAIKNSWESFQFSRISKDVTTAAHVSFVDRK